MPKPRPSSPPPPASTTTLTQRPAHPPPQTFTDTLPLPRLLVFDLDYTLWPFWVDTHVTPPLKQSSTPSSSSGSSSSSTGTKTKTVKDRHGEGFAFYPDVPHILAACRARGVKVAAASRTSAPDLAGQMLQLLTVSAFPPLFSFTPSSSASAAAAAGGASPGEAGGGEEGGKKKEKEKEEERAKARPAKSFFDNLQIYPGSKVRHLDKIRKATGVEFEDMVFFDDEGRNRDVERELGVLFILVTDGVTTGVIDQGVEKWRRMRGVV